MARETAGTNGEAVSREPDPPEAGRTERGSISTPVGRQRWSLISSVLVVAVGLAVSVALLIEAAVDVLPEVPGLNYGFIQGGLVAVVLAFCAYALERERRLRRMEDELDEERLRGERLVATDEAKNAFLRSISHDLRSPLTVILGTAVLLEGRGQELSAEKLREAASRIGTQARRLDSMLTDMLDIERVAKGILELQAVDVDVAVLVRSAVESLDVLDRPIELSEEPVRARVDEVLVERIVDNLVRNAVRYTPEGTTIWVRVSKEGPDVLLSVEDEGPGVPDERKGAVFEVFERGTASGGGDGTGIGLSLVRQFAELHGGRAWVEDRPGGGAAFRVLLGEPGEAGSAGDAEEAAG